MEGIAGDLEQMQPRPLADDHLAAIREAGQERSYPAGSMIVEVGEPMDRFILLLEGEAEAVDPFNGSRILNATMRAGQFLGEISFLSGGRWTLGIRAVSPTRTLEVARPEMIDLMSHIPELGDHIITVFAARRRRLFEVGASAIKLVGADRDPAVQKVETFLSRNRVPYQSYDLDGHDAHSVSACRIANHEPAVIFGNDRKIEDPDPRKVATLLGLDLDAGTHELLDLLIVGGGPAGVAAGVYAGSEGLNAMIVEDTAIGGQAGTSSRIENYMGFPTGISGGDLIYRGQIQAMKFGTRVAMPRRVVALDRGDDGAFCATLDDGNVVCARSVLVATGVQYRRLPIDRLQEFEGSGVYYAATEMEARFCSQTEVVLIGGGNSAGQAAMYLSRFARCVHVLVRGDSLAESMSTYLRERLEADPRIQIHYGSQVVALDGDDHLSQVVVEGPEGSSAIACRALFVMVGAAPNTGWVANLAQTDRNGFVLTGHDAGNDGAQPYATSCPGLFAVGDVRSGSVKRVASAVGEGSVVVSAIWAYLNAADRAPEEARAGERVSA